MNNINKGHHNKTRLLRIIKGLLPGFLMMFFPKKTNRIIFSSDHNVAYKHSSKYLFEYFLKHYAYYQVKFVINDNTKCEQLIAEHGDHFIETNSFLGSLYVLRAKTWVVSSLETPVGGVLLNWGRYTHHLSHGSPLKNIGLAENYSSKLKRIYYCLIRNNFSYFYSTAPIFNSVWANCLGISEKKVVVQAQARNQLIHEPLERLVDTIEQMAPSGKNVLYAPTWRPFSITKLFAFDDFDSDLLIRFLDEHDINIFLRLHPNFSETVELPLLLSPRVQILANKDVHDINLVLGHFDIVITDYSSIYIDFLLTLKPVMFLPYDYTEYERNVGFAIDFYKYTPGPKPESFQEFLIELKKLLEDSDYYLQDRVTVNNILNEIKGNPSQLNAEFILSKLENKS